MRSNFPVPPFVSALISGFAASLTATLATALLAGCANTAASSSGPNDNIIGDKLGAASALTDRASGVQQTQIALFDQTTRLIHQFDLSNMTVVRTLVADHPETPHSVLFDASSGLIADLTEGHVTLFDRAGHRTVDPLSMTDGARSAAYNASLGLIVIYDKSGSVGLLHYDTNGVVTSSWIGGSVVSDHRSLTAGDLLSDGTLVLALGDGSLARVSVTGALANQSWGTVTTVATALGTINWVAPVRGYTDRVLVTASNTSSGTTTNSIALVSLTSGAILSKHDFGQTEAVVLKAKCADGHIIAQTSSQVVVYYTDGVSVIAQAANVLAPLILSSKLSVADNSWSFIDSSKTVSWSYSEVEKELSGRTLRQYRLGDLASLVRLPLPDNAAIDTTDHFVFALFPDELGYAQRINLSSDHSVSAISRFNMGYIHR